MNVDVVARWQIDALHIFTRDRQRGSDGGLPLLDLVALGKNLKGR